MTSMRLDGRRQGKQVAEGARASSRDVAIERPNTAGGGGRYWPRRGYGARPWPRRHRGHARWRDADRPAGAHGHRPASAGPGRRPPSSSLCRRRLNAPATRAGAPSARVARRRGGGPRPLRRRAEARRRPRVSTRRAVRLHRCGRQPTPGPFESANCSSPAARAPGGLAAAPCLVLWRPALQPAALAEERQHAASTTTITPMIDPEGARSGPRPGTPHVHAPDRGDQRQRQDDDAERGQHPQDVVERGARSPTRSCPRAPSTTSL